jgi:hypothetical protein
VIPGGSLPADAIQVGIGAALGSVGVDVADLARVLGMALLGGLAGVVLGALYRGMTDERAPPVYPLLVGLGVVGAWLNTASALIAVVGTEPMALERATTNLLALIAGGVGALGGARVGDDLAPDVLALAGRRDLDREVGRVVQTVGRFTAVRVPEEIADIEGDEPVADAKKAELAGRELLFPRGLTVAELRERLVDRLKRDYGVGRVDAELSETGELTHLALGRRPAGVGATLPPGRAAVAVEADPAFDASPDDRVQVWERAADPAEGSDDGPSPSAADDKPEGARRVATADVRAVDGDVVTLSLPSDRARTIDQGATHRLVTLPTGERPEREFVSLLRAANETMEKLPIGSGSVLDGVPVAALKPHVVAVDAEGAVTTLPDPRYVLRGGETVYVVGRADELRRVRFAAEGRESGSDQEARDP